MTEITLDAASVKTQQGKAVPPYLNALFRGIFGSRAQSGDLSLVPFQGGAIMEFSWQTDEAVSSKYLKTAKEILSQLPKDRYDFGKTGISVTRDKWLISQDEQDNMVGLYVNSWQWQDKGKPDNIPSPNPFNTFMPAGLKNLDAWLREQGKEYEYKPYYSRKAEKEKQGYCTSERDSHKHEHNYIRVVHAWNTYHVGFLEALNIADAGEKKRRLDALAKEVFDKPLGFASTIPLKDISPYDNPNLWLVYHALNVLISPAEEISPVARYRVAQLLSQYNAEELKTAYFGIESSGISARGRERQSWGFEGEFDHIKRLPRAFWVTAKEKQATIHEDWEQNQRVKEIFGIPPAYRRGDRFDYDYGRIFNTLVEKYPDEAMHITILMLADSYIHKRAAFDGLLSLAQLDPISIVRIFGGRASYLRMHKMTKDEQDQIAEGLGLMVFDEDFASMLDGLTSEQIRQVVRRLQLRNMELEGQLARQSMKSAAEYFSSRTEQDLQRIDSKSYWRILGVHPDTDPKDLEETLKRNYRALARKYHPEGSEPDAEKMKKLNEAYEVLSDEERRKIYYGRQ